MGIENIVAVDGEEKRLEFAKELGAGNVVNFKNIKEVKNYQKVLKKHLEVI